MPGPQHVSDPRSHIRDQIANLAEALGKSLRKRKVFEAVNRGRNSHRTVDELVKLTRLPRQGVLDAAKSLSDSGWIHQIKLGRTAAYQKDAVLKHHKKKVLSLAVSRKKLEAFPTKTNPRVIVNAPHIRFPKQFFVSAQPITVDEIDSFKKVKKVRPSSVGETRMKEERFKNGVKKVIGETGKFQDWGGEKNDLFTTRMRISGRRIATALAFKGPGKKLKRLTPNMMGKNGDQIQRLFSSAAADAYLVQYWRQIDESIVEQMKMMAVAKSTLERKRIYFGVIDGTDSARLIKAYPKQFS